MVSGRTQAAWAERRALVEEAGASIETVALACGLNADALAHRAGREGWKRRGGETLSRQERIAHVHDRLLARIEREQTQTDAGDMPLDKAGIAELAATARILAKISEITRDEDGAKEKQMERDADIAAILDRIDGQIVALARHLAQEMAGDSLHAQGGVAGQP